MRKTTRRELTTRAVLYVGFPCNLKCKFCYYAYCDPKTSGWHPLEEAKQDASLFRDKHGNDRVDITGGEPTIYPWIHELVKHCKKIGLRPTLITNMQALAKEEEVMRFKKEGVYDFLCSVHNLYAAYDEVTQRKGGFRNVEQAIDNLHKHGIPWRANCTIIKTNMKSLLEIARWCHEHGARCINFIGFNPFYEWDKKTDIDFQARYTEMQPYLLKALAYCDDAGMEANVRYVPHCMVPGHKEKSYNYMQLPYDSHEWDFASWYDETTGAPTGKTDVQAHIRARSENDESQARRATYKAVANEQRKMLYVYPKRCAKCALQEICDGFSKQYYQRFKGGEAKPVRGKRISDPTHFIRHQEKIID